MKPAEFPRVKICCISSIDEARLAIRYGAGAIGLVGKMPSGPGVISDDLIAEITKIVPAGIETFLLTSETTAEGIIDHHRKSYTTTIQIVDIVDPVIYSTLRNELEGINLVQVVHVIDERSIDEALEYSKYADTLLLDSGNPNLSKKELGGTGRTHNWELSKKIRSSVDVPVYLAGGINAGNVTEAFHLVQPFGIDLCSGVRTGGMLDERKLSALFLKINEL